jgi:hypothetical protein
MKIKTTIYTLVSDDDSGTSAEVFTDERKAVERLVHGLKYIVDADEETIADLITAYFDNDRDFCTTIAQFKSDFDTYSIDEQTIELDCQLGHNNEAEILFDALSYWLDKLENDVASTNDGSGWLEINTEIQTVKSLIQRL